MAASELFAFRVTEEEKREIEEYVSSLPVEGGRELKPSTWARDLVLATVRKAKKATKK